MPEFKQELCWGENYSNSPRSLEWNCTNANCENSKYLIADFLSERFLKNIKGVRKAPVASDINHTKQYAAMVECPKCFTHYWFHIIEWGAEEIFERKNIK